MSAVTAPERRAPKRRRHADSIQALDVFAGFGGMSQALEAAGVAVIHAANHNPYAIDVHEANHPYAEHLIADFVDDSRPDYVSVADLPYADWAHLSPSCTNHSTANAQRAYLEGHSPHSIDDPEFDDHATTSERSRATMTCVLQYAAAHRPKVITVENVPEVRCWGNRVPGRSYGDGSTFRWWCQELRALGYSYELVDLNAQFFGVPQSRDRLFIVAWADGLRRPDLAHRPVAQCVRCDRDVESFKTEPRVPPSGRVRYGTSYHYACPSCGHRVEPPATPALAALDLTDLGPTLRERDKLPKQSTMDRIARAKARMGEFPAILMPAKALRGSERHPWQPMNTLTTQAETTLLSSGAIVVGAGNTFEWPGSDCRIRSLDKPLWTQTASNTTATLMAPVVVPFRANTLPTGWHAPMPAQTAQQVAGLISAMMPFRSGTLPTPLTAPTPTHTTVEGMALLTGLVKQNGGPEDTAVRSAFGPFGALTSVPTETLVAARLEFSQRLADLDVLDMHWRMLGIPEVRRGMGVDDDFVSWGPKRQQIAGYGNMVCPKQGQWVAERVKAIL